jgi:DNA-binding MarR family transcriptional regulator
MQQAAEDAADAPPNAAAEIYYDLASEANQLLIDQPLIIVRASRLMLDAGLIAELPNIDDRYTRVMQGEENREALSTHSPTKHAILLLAIARIEDGHLDV